MKDDPSIAETLGLAVAKAISAQDIRHDPPRELDFARCRHFRGPTMPWSCAHPAGHQLQVDANTTRLRGCLCYETDKTHECPDFDSGTGQMRLI